MEELVLIAQMVEELEVLVAVVEVLSAEVAVVVLMAEMEKLEIIGIMVLAKELLQEHLVKSEVTCMQVEVVRLIEAWATTGVCLITAVRAAEGEVDLLVKIKVKLLQQMELLILVAVAEVLMVHWMAGAAVLV
jgi:hypothetical protein